MKKVLVLISITASIVMVGCGDGGGADVTAGGKNSLNPERVAPNPETGKQSGVASSAPVPAPPGVKTGTPGG